MNLSDAKHSLICSMLALNRIAEDLEYSGAFCGSISLLAQSDTIWFTGLGKSGLVAQRGASMMRTIGRRSQFIHPVDALHGDMGCINDRDVIIALSHSGETVEVREFLAWKSTVPVIALCRLGSGLASRARYTLKVDADEKLPTISCMMQNAWIDALVIALSDNVEQVLQKTHPSGDIGRRLRESGPREP